MRIFLESAALPTISQTLEARLADGVFVTPGVLDSDAFGIDPVLQVETIARRITGPVLAMVGAVTADDLYTIGRDLARLSDQVTVVLPMVEDGLEALRRLATEGVRAAASFVVTPSQAFLAAKSGAVAVMLASEQIDEYGDDSSAAIRDTGLLFARHGVACDVIAAAGRSARLAAVGIREGADAVTLTASALTTLARHPVTDRAVDQMLGELSRRPRPRLSR